MYRNQSPGFLPNLSTYDFEMKRFQPALNTLLLFCLTGFWLSTGIWADVSGSNDSTQVQNTLRIIHTPNCPDSDEPSIEILGLNVGQQQVPLDSPFAADNQWLANLTFRVKNTTSKPVTCIVLTFGLLEKVDEELPTYASYNFGLRFVAGKTYLKNVKNPPKLTVLAQPNQEIEITSNQCRPYGLQHMDQRLAGKPSQSGNPLALVAGSRFCQARLMRADVQYVDGSFSRVNLLPKAKCPAVH